MPNEIENLVESESQVSQPRKRARRNAICWNGRSQEAEALREVVLNYQLENIAFTEETKNNEIDEKESSNFKVNEILKDENLSSVNVKKGIEENEIFNILQNDKVQELEQQDSTPKIKQNKTVKDKKISKRKVVI